MSGPSFSKERYRTFDFTTLSAGKGKIILHSFPSGKLMFISSSELQFLQTCRKFETLTNHAENYCRQLKLEQLTNRKGLLGKIFRFLLQFTVREDMELPVRGKEIVPFLEKLQQWVDQGLLVSEQDLLQEIKSLSEQNQNSEPISNKITIVGVPTCGRPKTLRRCLMSVTKNFKRYGRTPDILILDDSREEEDQRQNQVVLKELNALYEGDFYYMNRRQRKDFARAVADKAKVERQVVEFSLMGHPSCNRSEGGCRNAFLLLTQGRLALQTDDDTLCQMAQPSSNGLELVLTSESGSDKYWFFKSYEEAIHSVDFIEKDFLGIHEQMAGKRLGNVVIPYLENGTGCNVDKVESSFLRNLGQDNATIRMTVVGPVGDTCLFTDLHRLFLKGDSLQRLLYPEEEYQWHLATRHVIRSVTHPTISDFPRCIGMNFALDNRSLLPPFMPVQARCDGIFGDLLKFCFPGAFAGNLPYVLGHNPPEPRTRSVEEVFSLLEHVRVNDIISVLVHSFQNWPYTEDPEKNLRTLGDFLINLASYSPKEFEYRIRQLYASAVSQRIQRVEHRLKQQRNGTVDWTEHMQCYIRGLRNALADSNFLMPADIDNPTSNYQEDFKHIVHLSGKQLSKWPEIYRAMDDFSGDEMLNYVTKVREKVT